MLNTTDDNIMNSLSQMKPFEQSQTQPLRFEDEENKTGEELDQEMSEEAEESVDQEDLKM